MKSMLRVLRISLGGIAVLLLAACESPRFVAEVTQFHELPSGAAQSFTVAAANPAKEESLEFRSYARSVARSLEREGFRPAAPGQEGDLVVLVDYGVGPGEVRRYAVPVYGYYPDHSTHISGIRRGDQRYSAHVYESGGFIPLGYTEMTEVLYTRKLTMEMLDAAAWRQGQVKKSYEGRVISHGSESDIAAVMPLMIEALFATFPGNNGATQTVILEPES